MSPQNSILRYRHDELMAAMDKRSRLDESVRPLALPERVGGHNHRRGPWHRAP